MAKVRVRRVPKPQEQPTVRPNLEYFCRQNPGEVWHVVRMLPHHMEGRCGLILRGDLLVCPAAGKWRCPSCFEGGVANVDTHTREELQIP